MADLSFEERLLIGNIHKAVRTLEMLISKAREKHLDVKIEIFESSVIGPTRIPERHFSYSVQAEVTNLGSD